MILVIGDAIRDDYLIGTVERISPEAPVPVVLNPKKVTKLGGVWNVRNNLAALGAMHMTIFDTTNVSTKTRIVADKHIICRIDDEQYVPMSITNIPEANYVVLSDYNKGALHYSYDICKKCNERGSKVLVDMKKPFASYSYAWLVKCNDKELKEFTKDWGSRSLQEIYEGIQQFGIQNLLVTHGENGMTLVNSNGMTKFEAEKRTVTDVTGAGDIVIAALAHFLDKGEPLLKACEFANKLAGISVSHFGTYVLTKDDIFSVIGKTVFTNGCFDILHSGHVDMLNQSRKLGTKLIVGINSDSSVKRLKGSQRPVNNQNARKQVLEALACVDEVIIFDEDTPLELIKSIKPDIITKGGDYTIEKVIGNELAEVVIIPITNDISTTKVINEITRNYTENVGT